MVDNTGIPITHNEKQAQLMAALADELKQRSINITPGACMALAGYLAERVVAEGWQWHPPKAEEPLADWEKELNYTINNEAVEWRTITHFPSVDYIINRAGIVKNKITGETVAPSFNRVYLQWEVIIEIDGTKYHFLAERIAEDLFTPAKKAEDVEPTWVRIPKFEDYEVNSLGVVRNFWTKRVLGVRGTDAFVELHDDQGYPRNMTVKAVMDKAFPKEG